MEEHPEHKLNNMDYLQICVYETIAQLYTQMWLDIESDGANDWLDMPNSQFDGYIPRQLIHKGHGELVCDWLRDRCDGGDKYDG